MKLNIQLASSLNLIWKSLNLEAVVAFEFLVSLVDLYENFPRYFTILKNITNFTFGKIKRIKFSSTWLTLNGCRFFMK